MASPELMNYTHIPYCRWSRAQVLKALRKRMRQKLSMSSGKVYQSIPSVWRAAQRIFGSWEKVRQELGIKLDPMTKWPVTRLIATLRPLCEQRHLSPRLQRRRPYVWKLILQHFPSQAVVMKKFGIPVPVRKHRGSPIWSREKIIKCLQDRVRRKQPINTGALQRKNDALYDAACYYFGSYRQAVEAAGYDYTRIGQWQRDAISVSS